MPLFILFIASILGLAALNGRVSTMMQQLRTDLFGGGGNQDYGFIVWAGALILVAALLRAIDLPQAGRMFIVLVLLVFLLSNGNLLNSLIEQLKSVGTAPAAPPPPGPLGANITQQKSGLPGSTFTGGLANIPTGEGALASIFGKALPGAQIDYSGLGSVQ